MRYRGSRQDDHLTMEEETPVNSEGDIAKSKQDWHNKTLPETPSNQKREKPRRLKTGSGLKKPEVQPNQRTQSISLSRIAIHIGETGNGARHPASKKRGTKMIKNQKWTQETGSATQSSHSVDQLITNNHSDRRNRKWSETSSNRRDEARRLKEEKGTARLNGQKVWWHETTRQRARKSPEQKPSDRHLAFE
jgi:hypothetical protein